MTALNEAWAEINALGGRDGQKNPYDQGIVDTVAKALDIIEKLGGVDPLTVKSPILHEAVLAAPSHHGEAMALAACPFCGKQPRVEQFTGIDQTKYGLRVRCCWTDIGNAEIEFVKKTWNTRTASVSAVREVLEDPSSGERHTTGPFIVSPLNPNLVQQDDPLGLIVADCSMTDEGAANAAFIVRAWNSYEANSRPPAWECSARKQSLPEPADCSWPTCGCDPLADKVIAALEEQGLAALASQPRDGWRDVIKQPDERWIPTYGQIPWEQLGRDVNDAIYARRRDYEFDPSYYPGHQTVPSINFNSLARIVDKYRYHGLPCTTAFPTITVPVGGLGDNPDAHGDGYCGCTERCKDRDNCQYDVKPDDLNRQDEVLLAYGMLWCVNTTDKRVHTARRELLKCLDKELQAKAISAARTTLALVQDIRKMKGATFAADFPAKIATNADGDVTKSAGGVA